MKKPFLYLSFIISLNFVSAQDTIVKGLINQPKGIGLVGYDAVSYFMDKPLKGKEEFQTEYNGVSYQFDNAPNLNTFLENPNSYLPVYGGWCAYAIGDSGDLVSVDPETYKIIDGKLYLFYNAPFNNTLKKWNKDETLLLQKAEMNWHKRLNSMKGE